MAVNRLFVDTGAFLGMALPRDQFHQISREIWSQLGGSAARLYSSDAVFQETMGLLHVRAGVKFTTRWAEIQLQAKVIDWLPIDAQVRRQSLPWIKKRRSRCRLCGRDVFRPDATGEHPVRFWF